MKLRWTAALIPMVLVLLSCRPEPWQVTRYALGTEILIKFYNPRDKVHAEPLFAEMDRLESLFSRNRPGSDPGRVAESSGISPVPVAPETLKLAEASLRFYDLSGGLFDPTIAPLVDLWGIGSDHARVPSDRDLQQALALIDGRRMVLDPVAGTLFLPDRGMGVEFGAIAKGFIAEELAAFLEARGVRSAILNLGGNVRVIGEKPDGSPFLVSVQDPLGPRGRSVGIVALREGSVVTSGVYERFFEQEGRRYHHILDPLTGYPSQSGLLSVTIITRSGTDADGLSTTVFLLGAERGMSLIESLPGTEAVLITDKNEMLLSSGAAALFTPETGSPYRITTP